LVGGIQCLYDEVCFCDLVWFIYLQWVLVYCGSYICNNISCLVGFFSCTSHLLVVLSTLSNEGLHKKKLKLPLTSSMSKCYYHLRHLRVSKLKKRRPHSIFFPTLYLLLFHLAQQPRKMKIKDFTLINKRGWRLPTSIAMFLFIFLLLVSSFFESRDKIQFKGLGLSHPEISQFQDVNKKNN
jgi:hypothetical protein